MDPQACLDRLTEAYEDGDSDEVVEAAGDLIGWLVKGGFMPTVTRGPMLALLSIIVEA